MKCLKVTVNDAVLKQQKAAKTSKTLSSPRSQQQVKAKKAVCVCAVHFNRVAESQRVLCGTANPGQQGHLCRRKVSLQNQSVQWKSSCLEPSMLLKDSVLILHQSNLFPLPRDTMESSHKYLQINLMKFKV